MAAFFKQYDVVILDSGVMSDHPVIKNEKPIDAISLSWSDESEEFILSNEGDDIFGHGTAVSAIIRKGAPDVAILMIRLIRDWSGVEEACLLRALEFIHKNIICKVINLSLGITLCENYSAFYQVCKSLSDDGVLIVAAFDNDGAFSYPAVFDCVIGVNSGPCCTKKKDFEFYEDEIVNIGAMGKVQRLAWTKPSMLCLGGNSFACAHVTVQVLQFLNKGEKTLQQVLRCFQEISIAKNHLPKKKPLGEAEPLFSIHKAVLFPFNKEMHSLVRYADMLDFSIVDIYNSKYSLMVGANVRQIMNNTQILDRTIKNISEIDWNSFDTLILGHTDEMMNATNAKELKLKLITQALQRNKNIYAFDDLSDCNISLQKNIYYPCIWEKDLPKSRRHGKLYQLSKPIVGIFGTSSKQGKFTLQLMLRKKLQERGYCIGQLGTEPSALLFHMDEIFPMGYNSSVYINNYDIVRYLNTAMNKICMGDAELILVGSQSGTVAYHTSNLEYLTIAEYLFLLGTQPDAVILNVNPYDEMDYIERTIKFIESSIECKVIAIVVFPMTIESDWIGIYGHKKQISNNDYLNLKQELEHRFNCPIYRLGNDDDMENITDLVLDFFS